MNKRELTKNKLDLEYGFEAKRAILFLTASTIMSVSFAGYMLSQEKYNFASIIGSIIFFTGMIFYFIAKRRMKDIVKSIENL